MRGMEYEHSHAPSFTEGHADFYRGCPVCDELARLLGNIAMPTIDFHGRAIYEVRIPNIREIPPEDFYFRMEGSEIVEAGISEPPPQQSAPPSSGTDGKPRG